MTISKAQYLGKYAKNKDLTPKKLANTDRLLTCVNRLLMLAVEEGQLLLNSPATKNLISTDVGGYRPPEVSAGAPLSAHRDCLAVDIFDGIDGALGKWVMTSKKAQALIQLLGLYFEHPDDTKGKITHWLHATLRAPESGSRFFHP